jgi:hypothetical protein
VKRLTQLLPDNGEPFECSSFEVELTDETGLKLFHVEPPQGVQEQE